MAGLERLAPGRRYAKERSPGTRVAIALGRLNKTGADTSLPTGCLLPDILRIATPSHRLKLKRAYKHVAELADMLKAFGVRQPCPVIETVETDGNKRQFVGDFLFDVRSALDHLAVALAPASRKYKASFPIHVTDPLATSEESGEYLNADAARAWISRTKGMPSCVVAHLTVLQPHCRAREQSECPENYSLAVLSALENADKHRDLVTVVTGLAEPYLSCDGGNTWEPGHPDAVLKNGARLHTAEESVEVKVEGAPIVGVGRPDEVRDLLLYRDLIVAGPGIRRSVKTTNPGAKSTD